MNLKKGLLYSDFPSIEQKTEDVFVFLLNLISFQSLLVGQINFNLTEYFVDNMYGTPVPGCSQE